MTRKILYILLFLGAFKQYGYAQSQTYHERSGYVAITAGAGILAFRNVPGQMNLQFPYTVTDASGTVTHQVFQSKAISSYSRPSLMGDINLEMGNWRNCVSIGIHPANNQAYIYMGYGYNLYFDVKNHNKSAPSAHEFVLKPSFNIAFSDYAHADKKTKDFNYLGSIDNADKTIELLGHVSSPSFHYKSGEDYESYTEDTKTLDLYFGQIDWVFIPEITLSDNQYKHIFRWEVNIGYHIPFYENGGIQMFQNDWHMIKSPRINGLNENGVVATLNQKVVTSSPYKLSGFFASVTIGLNLSPATIAKMH